VDRVDGDVETRRARLPGAEPVAKEQPRRVVLGPLANHYFSGDVHQVEDAVDRVAGGRVCLLLIAPAQPVQHVEGRVLRCADELELDGPFRVRSVQGLVHRSPPRRCSWLLVCGPGRLLFTEKRHHTRPYRYSCIQKMVSSRLAASKALRSPMEISPSR